jgi:hypothetical protein
MGKQVKTPRFYVDIPTFLHSIGDTNWGYNTGGGGAELLYINPSNPYIRTQDTQGYIFKVGRSYPAQKPKTNFAVNFVALLNHNLGTETMGEAGMAETQPFIRGRIMKETDDANAPREPGSVNLVGSTSNFTNVINTEKTNNNGQPVLKFPYNGTSIYTFSDYESAWVGFEVFYHADLPEFSTTFPHQLGSLVVGRYWDAPNSPDLSLTMSRRFDGIKTKKTMGGKTLSNIYYDGPTEWTMNRENSDWDTSAVTYKYPPFELDEPDRIDGMWSASGSGHFDDRVKSGLGRKGLRSWNLTFSYISEDNMWMENEVSNRIINDTQTSSNSNPMLYDDSFNFVWNCTLGGTLPFIFQPDNTNNNADQFSICTFNQKTLSVKQVAYNTYTLSVTIDEVA